MRTSPMPLSSPSTTTNSRSSTAQITRSGRNLQAEIRPISIANVLSELEVRDEPSGVDREIFHKVSAADRSTTIRGAYLHVPFCFHKCHYCDFYSIVDS